VSARLIDGVLYVPVAPNEDGLADLVPLIAEEDLP